jgi:hypothetical protein
MASPKAELASDIKFIKTPAPQPSAFETGEDCGVHVTNVSPDPKNARCMVQSLRPVDIQKVGIPIATTC